MDKKSTTWACLNFSQILITLACATVISAIPVGEDSSKSLNEVVRQKRGGWSYAPTAYAPAVTSFYPSPEIHTVLGPTKTIITAAHPPVTTAVVVPRYTAVSYPTSHAESVVWSSGPDHHYFIHQRHSPRTYYYYPTATATHILNPGPVVAW